MHYIFQIQIIWTNTIAKIEANITRQTRFYWLEYISQFCIYLSLNTNTGMGKKSWQWWRKEHIYVKNLSEYPNLLWTLTGSFIIASLPCERSRGADLWIFFFIFAAIQRRNWTCGNFLRRCVLSSITAKTFYRTWLLL
jgi:hypothetical protein